MIRQESKSVVTKDKALLFLHIPKAAGTTLRNIVERQFSPHVTFNIPGTRAGLAIQQFQNLPEQERRHIRLVEGHMPYGLHQYLSVPATYITMLRDPVDRVISHYYFVLGLPHHHLHHEVTSQHMSLADYVQKRVTMEVFNDQTLLISGAERAESRPSSDHASGDSGTYQEYATEETLRIAKRNLAEHFSVVGLSERFDESLLLFKREFGWRNIYYVKHNVTRERPLKEEVPPEERALIERHNELDIELYRYARERFERAIREQGASFSRELESFRRANRLYARAWGGYNLTRRLVPAKLKTVIKNFYASQA